MVQQWHSAYGVRLVDTMASLSLLRATSATKAPLDIGYHHEVWQLTSLTYAAVMESVTPLTPGMRDSCLAHHTCKQTTAIHEAVLAATLYLTDFIKPMLTVHGHAYV